MIDKFGEAYLNIIKEDVFNAKRDFHSYRYKPTEEQIYNRAVKEVQKTKNVKQEDIEKLAKKITKNLMLMKSFRDEDDYNDTFWDEYAQTVNDYKFRGVIKESKIIKEDVDFDHIINYWRCSDVDETKYPDEKLKEFIEEFYLDENGNYTVVDLEDTMDGEYGTPEYAPEFEWDQLLFVYLNPDNTVTVESDEGRSDFEDWMEAKNYLIEQGEDEGVFDSLDDEDEEDEDQ